MSNPLEQGKNRIEYLQNLELNYGHGSSGLIAVLQSAANSKNAEQNYQTQVAHQLLNQFGPGIVNNLRSPLKEVVTGIINNNSR